MGSTWARCGKGVYGQIFRREGGGRSRGQGLTSALFFALAEQVLEPPLDALGQVSPWPKGGEPSVLRYGQVRTVERHVVDQGQKKGRTEVFGIGLGSPEGITERAEVVSLAEVGIRCCPELGARGLVRHRSVHVLPGGGTPQQEAQRECCLYPEGPPRGLCRGQVPDSPRVSASCRHIPSIDRFRGFLKDKPGDGQACSGGEGARGRRISRDVPEPAALPICTLPLWASTMPFTMANPRPVPLSCRAAGSSAR